MSVTFDFGTLDLDVDLTTTARTATGSFDFGGLTFTATGVRKGIPWPGAALFDENNQWVCNLPLADGLKWQRAISDPGFVSLRLPLDDPNTAEATYGRFLKVFWRGACRQAARIGDSHIDIAVDGRRWLVFDNLPGVLSLLADGCVWPEYGIDRTYSTTRTFGYMSATNVGLDATVGWFKSGNWTPPVDPFHFQADTGFRQFKPAGLSYPNPQWISKRGAYHKEPPGARQWLRRQFWTYSVEIDYQILATADDLLTLWLDGEKLISADPQQTEGWRQLFQVTGKLPAGEHVLAAEIRNGKRRDSPMAFICTLQQLKKNGDVVTGPPIINSHQFWNVSDVLPGFRRGDVIRRCIFENRLHDVDALDLISIGFTAANDSDGVEWADTPDEYSFDVGADLLSTSQTLAERFLDLDMDPDRLRLLGYNRKGADLSATVQIPTGAGTIGSVVEESVDRTGPKFTVVLTQLGDGTWIEDENTAGAAAYGRRVTSVSLGAHASEAAAAKVSRALFTENAQPHDEFSVIITDRAGPQPHRDFEHGDTISVQDQAGDWVPVRVMAIKPDYTGSTGFIELEVVRDES